jgi:succinate dehydrogenase / fumarate reductase cytochrome b subunit
MSDADGGAGAKAKLAPRPLSPHIWIWRWHITMLGSILHRASGIALYAGALLLTAWAVALASGPRSYFQFQLLLASPVGKLVLAAITLAAFYHLANGVRHLAWDSGVGFKPRTADLTGWAVIAFAIVATAAVWAVAASTGLL